MIIDNYGEIFLIFFRSFSTQGPLLFSAIFGCRETFFGTSDCLDICPLLLLLLDLLFKPVNYLFINILRTLELSYLVL